MQVKVPILIIIILFISQKITLAQQDNVRNEIIRLLESSDEIEYSETDSALTLCLKAMKLAKESNDEYYIAESHYYLGGLYDIQGYYQLAYNNYFDALKIFKKLEVDKRIGGCYNCIAIVLWEQTEQAADSVKIVKLNKASDYCKKGIEHHNKCDFTAGLAMCNMNLGIFYDDLAQIYTSEENKQYTELAIERYENAMGYFEEIEDRRSMADCYLNIAALYKNTLLEDSELNKQEYEKIRDYNIRAGDIYIDFNDLYGLSMVYNNLASLNLKYSKKPEQVELALNQAQLALNYADSVGGLFLKYDAYHTLFKAYKAGNQFKKALRYHELYLQTKDSVHQNEQINALEEMETRYSVKEKEQEIKLQKIEIQQAHDKQVRHWIILGVALVIIAIISRLLLSIYRVNKKNEEANILLNRQNTDLEQLNRTQNKLMSIISHDLKAPLSAFYSITNSLKNKYTLLSQDEISNFFTRMLSSAVSLKLQLENMLNWSINQSRSIKPNKIKINLHILVCKIVVILQEFAAEKEITIQNKIDENLEFETDDKLLGIVLNNLISNAVKFSKAKGEIIITGSKKSDSIRIFVKDFGVGISELDLQNLFINNGDVSKKQGSDTGLGLTVSKDIVEKLGGKIWAESKLGEFTEFFIELPV